MPWIAASASSLIRSVLANHCDVALETKSQFKYGGGDALTTNAHDNDGFIRPPVIRIAVPYPLGFAQRATLLKEPHQCFATTLQDFLAHEILCGMGPYHVRDLFCEPAGHVNMAEQTSRRGVRRCQETK